MVRLLDPRSRTSACQRGVLTFIDSIRDLIKGTTIALLGDGWGVGEGGHGSEGSSWSSGCIDLEWFRGRWLWQNLWGNDGLLNTVGPLASRNKISYRCRVAKAGQGSPGYTRRNVYSTARFPGEGVSDLQRGGSYRRSAPAREGYRGSPAERCLPRKKTFRRLEFGFHKASE